MLNFSPEFCLNAAPENGVIRCSFCTIFSASLQSPTAQIILSSHCKVDEISCRHMMEK